MKDPEKLSINRRNFCLGLLAASSPKISLNPHKPNLIDWENLSVHEFDQKLLEIYDVDLELLAQKAAKKVLAETITLKLTDLKAEKQNAIQNVLRGSTGLTPVDIALKQYEKISSIMNKN